MIMVHLQRFVTSLTAVQRSVLLQRLGIYSAGACEFEAPQRHQYNFGAIADWRHSTVSKVREVEARVLIKFDRYVLKPYLESQRRENDD